MKLARFLTAAALPLLLVSFGASDARAQARAAPYNPGGPGAQGGVIRQRGLNAPRTAPPQYVTAWRWRMNIFAEDTMVYPYNGFPAAAYSAAPAGPGAGTGVSRVPIDPSINLFGVLTPPGERPPGDLEPPGGPPPVVMPPVQDISVPAVRLTSVTPNGAAARAGLEVGDVISRINNERVTSVGQLVALLQRNNGAVRVRFKNVRSGNFEELDMTLDAY